MDEVKEVLSKLDFSDATDREVTLLNIVNKLLVIVEAQAEEIKNLKSEIRKLKGDRKSVV